MNAENFRDYLNDPSLLYQVPYEELKSLALEYPYNAHLRWLLLQKSRMEHRPDARKALEKAAVYSIDRKALYRFVQTHYEKSETPFFVFNEDFLELKDLSVLHEELAVPVEDPIIARPVVADPIAVFREPPVAPQIQEEAEEELAFDFTALIAPETAETSAAIPFEVVGDEPATTLPPEPEAEATPDVSYVDRVANDAAAISSAVEYRSALAAADAVLEKAAQIAPVAPLPKATFRSWTRPALPVSDPEHEPAKAPPPVVQPEKKTKKAPDVVAEIARLSVTENTSLATETLADLLAAQQQYDKAAKMYERLILKFPEKSAYFAAKIEKLKKK
ncbi:MAG: hypothetical protein HUU01_00735 [Saprospiraceae bacterium]|nr:hypothetical protein [Saprospiraceae bacterium]